MMKLKRYLKPYIGFALAAIVLMFCQAAVDLNLPNLMSDIVNVGIQQGGVEIDGTKVTDTAAQVSAQAEEMKQLLRAWKDGRIIIFSTHIMDLALDLCDEIVLLSHGELEAVEKSNLDNREFKEKIIAALKEETYA